MNNTHYALIDENNVIAVIKKDNFQERILIALRDEFDSAVTDVTIEDIHPDSFRNYSVTAIIDGYSFKGYLRPVWEY